MNRLRVELRELIDSVRIKELLVMRNTRGVLRSGMERLPWFDEVTMQGD